MSFEIDDRPSHKREPCKICGRLYLHIWLLQHAKQAHREAYLAWRDGRGGFGMSIFEHFGTQQVDRAEIRT